MWHRLGGLPGLADRANRLGGSPHLSCKRNQIKMRGYIDRRVTPDKRVTSLTWGPHLHLNRTLVQRQNHNTTICFKPLQVKSMEVQWEAVKLITYLKLYNWELVKTLKRKINETFQQMLKFSETRSIVRQCIQFNLFKVFSTTQIKCVEINPKTAALTSNYHYSSISDIQIEAKHAL